MRFTTSGSRYACVKHAASDICDSHRDRRKREKAEAAQAKQREAEAEKAAAESKAAEAAAAAAEEAAEAKKTRAREKKAMQKERSRLRLLCSELGEYLATVEDKFQTDDRSPRHQSALSIPHLKAT